MSILHFVNRASPKSQRGGQNGMAFCQQLVGECLLLLVVDSTQFTGKNSREIAKMSRGGVKMEWRFVDIRKF